MVNTIESDKRPHFYKCPYCYNPFHEKIEAVAHIKAKHQKQLTKHTPGAVEDRVTAVIDYEPGTIFERR
jgi:hypothetical protein